MEQHIKNLSKQLLTVLVLSVEPSDGISTLITDTIDLIVTKHSGKLTTYNETLTASFEGPSSAVYCGLALIKRMQNTNFSMGAVVHILEVSPYEEMTLSKEISLFVNAVLEKIHHGQIQITQTVKQLIAGRDLLFTEQYKTLVFFVDQQLSLFTVSDTHLSNHRNSFSYDVSKDHTLIASIIKCIDQHMDKDIGVNTLCEAVGISRRHLQRKLRVITNKSPGQFINFIKLHHAKELLQSQDLSIAEVAFSVGLSPSYFSKKFKEEFGISPSNI